jgi:hypothetical protein
VLYKLEMVKIVNGVIVSDTAPEAQSTEQANSNALFTGGDIYITGPCYTYIIR